MDITWLDQGLSAIVEKRPSQPKFIKSPTLLHRFFTPCGYDQPVGTRNLYLSKLTLETRKKYGMSTLTVSKQTQKNWWINAALFFSAMVAMVSGTYFLFLPTGNFQGGRNPLYNVQILFARRTWDDLHTWGGIAMIVAAIVHLVIHWPWVVGMARRTWKELTGRYGGMNPRARWNLVLDVVVAASFLFTAISGVYFLFVTRGRWAADPMILFARSTWDMIHTWAGVVLISLAVIHFVIHWKWVTKVTQNMLSRGSGSHASRQTEPVIVSQ
jgi:hypothetical protein